jgi:VanZ family protein
VHQLLLPGRSFQWLDLTADLAGALAAALLVLLLGSLLRSRR